jgi:hypothetical protein
MSDVERTVDAILEQLVRDVEASLHAMYRGDIRQVTTKTKTDAIRNAARDALLPLMGVARRVGDTTPSHANTAVVAPDEVAAITRCITGWLPMGAPSTTSPQTRCIPAAKELSPTWGEREKARLAIRRAAS